jgi:hypothetical protein
MSLYALQKILYELNRDESLRDKFAADPEEVADHYELSGEERGALLEPDIGLLYVLGVNGQILMHYAAYRGFEWFDYLEAMRKGVKQHGPVRAGVYTLTGGGQSFTAEGKT